jgi:XRE family aerobic/anaerobic benzoate catabolism transcriptional regulator
MDVQGFLSALGRRLRAARAAKGWSLTHAAREAGVSRRYLTEAEAGRANPSVVVLARLAAALDVAPAALLAGAGSGTPEPSGRIALCGLRGAGKSTVGRALARALECPFVELDRRVEELSGLSLGELFGLHGEDLFHRYEAEALESVLAEGQRVVIAAGGSIVAAPETFRRLRAACRTVWLRAAPEEHFRRVAEQGDRRPMRGNPRAMEELRSILARREPAYAQCDVALDTSGRAPAEIVAELVRLSEERAGDERAAVKG